MKSLTVAALVLAGVAPRSGAQAFDFTKTVWPERIAVGARAAGQLGPLTVEATKTGWVTINFLRTRPDFGGLEPPTSRFMAEAADLRRWIQQLRPVLQALLDSGSKLDAPSKARLVARGSMTLGMGRYQADVSFSHALSWYFGLRACGSQAVGAGPTTRELLDLLALLDTAATIAGGGAGRPPTLARPYYSIEISCPVVADLANVLPRPPAGMSPPIGEVATEFVVDTAGFIERGSIRVMASVSPALGDSVRAAVAHWHFVPAEIGGNRVRQIVQMGIPIGPRPAPSQQPAAEATSDGWVRVATYSPWSHSALREWYEPDSIDAFVARVQALHRQQDTLLRDTTVVPHRAVLVAPGREPLTAAFARRAGSVEMQGSLSDCTGMEIPIVMSDVAPFIAAARQARVNRSRPADPTLSVHEWSDVTCRVWDPWTPATRGELSRVSNYPVGAYPESMRPTNARAEVLTSFVVDTTGNVDMNSVEVMPGSDPRADAAIQTTLLARRFRPARRSGVKVPQRVIEAIRFEPPPVCTTQLSSPACPRRYTP